MDRPPLLSHDPMLTDAATPSTMSQPRPAPKANTNGPPQPIQHQQQAQPTITKPKPKPKTPKPKKTKVAPLPATVEVRGYEITIPNTKTCWRVHILHACRHPVMEISKVRYPGCDRPLVFEVNRHMRPCTEKCKVEGIEHIVGLCQACLQQKQGNMEVGGPMGSVFPGASGDGMDVQWDDFMPQF